MKNDDFYYKNNILSLFFGIFNWIFNSSMIDCKLYEVKFMFLDGIKNLNGNKYLFLSEIFVILCVIFEN